VKRIVLTGAKGLLGSAFLETLQHAEGVEIFPIQHKDLDMSKSKEVLEMLYGIKPDYVMNCAAHTDVEAAEWEPQADYKANAELPKLIAEACTKMHSTIIHFSSTGCYGSWKASPYTEGDQLCPTTAHHRAKRDGEEFILRAGCQHLIFRLGWLYGGAPAAKKNFVWNRLVEASKVSRLVSDASQKGCPTYVEDVVGQVLRVVGARETGIFNLTSHGCASRFDYVSEIVNAAKLKCVVTPGPAFVRIAPVSANEISVNQRLGQKALDQMQEWRYSLNTYVHKLLVSQEWIEQQSV
jgi:dTDP-4-dehydrorhamnose reductase